MKVCSKCHIKQKEENFRHAKNRAGDTVLRAECKSCEKKRNEEYNVKNRLLRNEKAKAYRSENKIMMAKRSSEWKKQHRPQINKARKINYSKNKGRILELQKISAKKRYAKIRTTQRKIEQRGSVELQGWYVRKQMTKRGVFSKSFIEANPEAVDIYRQIIKIKRLCKRKNQQ